MHLLAGKTALVVGVANKRSIAWGIAQAFQREGAQLILTYQNDRLKENVEKLAQTLPSPTPLYPLDVTSDEELARLAAALERGGHRLDVVVHSVAHARREDLEGDFTDTSRDGFLFAQDVSAYSLVGLSRALRPLLNEGASIITLTYLGSQRVAPNYNVMGVAKASLEACVRYLAVSLGPRQVRVNAISAGAIKTLAASGVKGLSTMLATYAERAPLHRPVTSEDVGDVAVFLASDLARAVTGNIVYADNGFHVLAV